MRSSGSMKMKSLLSLSCALMCLGFSLLPSAGADIVSQSECLSAAGCQLQNRREYTIRESADDSDDISAEFEEGIRLANNGGTLSLPRGKKFVIGKKLDLKNLNDIHVALDGEIKV